MATDQVPGYNPANNDQLRIGAWAEHADGSLIFVKSVEGGIVVYEIYDLSKKPAIFFPDAMAEAAFKREFSWKGTGDKWIWHDKVEAHPFPWERVMASVRPGEHYADVEAFLSAAEKVARKRRQHRDYVVDDDDLESVVTAAERLRRRRELQVGLPVDPADLATRVEQRMSKLETMIDKIQRAVSRAKPAEKKGK